MRSHRTLPDTTLRRTGLTQQERAYEPTGASRQCFPSSLQPHGQVAFLHRHELARRNELLRNVDDAERAMASASKPRHNVTLVLDNLRSAENVGSIFRCSDAARVSI